MLEKFRTTMISRWGLVFILIFIIAIVTERALKGIHQDKKILEKQYENLEMKFQQSYDRQVRLNQQLNSQSDPAWIELVIKRELGLVSEGETKIYFIESK